MTVLMLAVPFGDYWLLNSLWLFAASHCLTCSFVPYWSPVVTSGWTSPLSSGKCVRFGAGRSSSTHGRVLQDQDLVNWYCRLLTRRMVCGRAAGNTSRTQKQTEWNETRNCANSVVARQDHCSDKTPTTNRHIKKIWFSFPPGGCYVCCLI